MEITVHKNIEPAGFMVKFVSDKFRTYRYIITKNDKFIAVNPFKMPSTSMEFDDFDSAFAKVKEML